MQNIFDNNDIFEWNENSNLSLEIKSVSIYENKLIHKSD